MHLQNLEDKNLLEEFRSEVNLLTYPFFALTTKDIFNRKKSEFKAVVSRDDEKLEVLWRVSADTEYGYPGPFEKKVHRAVEQIIEEGGTPVENPIRFSIYELCKRMGISTGGPNYEKIKKAFGRIVSTTIKSEGTLFQKDKKRWVDRRFHLYDSITFRGEERNNGEIAETNCLYLNDVYLKSLNARYVKPIDFDYYRDLDTNIAQRLYELLGVKFYGIYDGNQSYIRYKYSTLCQLLPLKRCEFLSTAKQRLDPAHEELEKGNFFDKVFWKEVEGERDWYIFYYPGAKATSEIKKYKRQSIGAETEVKGRPKRNSRKSEEEVEELVDRMAKVLGKREQNEGFYYKVARYCPEDLINMGLKDTQMEERTGGIEKDKPAFFGYWIQELCEKRDIDLGLDPSTDVKVVGDKGESREDGNEEPEVSARSDSSNSKRKEERRQGQFQQGPDEEKTATKPELEPREEREAEKATEREAKLMEHYHSLSQEKQEEIDHRAMENLNDFTKGKARRLKKEGKDPLKESVAVKADFKANRFEILRKEMTPDD